MDFLRNFVVNLHATGPAAVLIVWLGAVAGIGIFGTGEHAGSALGILGGSGGFLIWSLASRA
jgi:hypothetical protein